MPKIAITLIPLLFVACSGDPTAPDPTSLRTTSPAVPQTVSTTVNGATRDTYRIDLPLNWLLTPTEFPCLTESIQLSGTIQEHLVFIDSPSSLHLTVHQTTDNLTAVGLTTGDRYAFSGPLTFTLNGPTDQGDIATLTFHNINHFVGPGPDANIFFRTLFHFTRDRRTNEIKVDIALDDVLCH